MISDSIAFKILSLLGCWLTAERNERKFSKILYWIYSTFLIINILLILIIVINRMLIILNNDDHLFIKAMIVLNTLIFMSFKIKILIFDRVKILNMDYLCNSLITANSKFEILVQKNHAKRIKYITILYESYSSI